jgi:predicted RNase H-like HicB family nuclease
MPYLVVIEKSGDGYGAYVPDLPGCVAIGDTADEVKRLIRDAIKLHLEGLREDETPPPEPFAIAD